MAEDHPADRPDPVTLLDRETLYQGFHRVSRYRLTHARFAGGASRPIVREVIERRAGVCVLPYDPRKDQVVLIEQFRIAPYVVGERSWMVEVIAGMVEPGERPEDVARREAEEEAGLSLGELRPISRFYVSPGDTSEVLTLFCAPGPLPDDVGGVHGLDSEGEDIRVLPLRFDAAMAMLADGRIVAGPAIVALQWLALNRAELRRGTS